MPPKRKNKRGLPPVRAKPQAERTISSVRAEGAGQMAIGGARPGAQKVVASGRKGVRNK